MPAGNTSVNATPVASSTNPVLSMVKVSVLTWSVKIVSGAKALVKVGGMRG